jgi:hypothetical protein
MPTQKIITVYTYDELNEQARETARQNYMEAFGYDDFRYRIGWIEEELSGVGLTITDWDAYRAGAKVKINKDTYTKTFVANVAGLTDRHLVEKAVEPCKALLAKMKRLDRLGGLCNRPAIQHRQSENLYTNLCEVYDLLEKEIANDTDEILRDISGDVGRLLQSEYEYTESEEYIKESFETNEYLFFFNGTVAPRDLQDAPLALAQN